MIVHDHDSCRTHNHVYEEVPKPCTALHSRGSFKNSSRDWKLSHSLKTSMTQFTAELRLRDLHLDAGLLQYMILHWACYISPLLPLSKECSSFEHWDLATYINCTLVNTTLSTVHYNTLFLYDSSINYGHR